MRATVKQFKMHFVDDAGSNTDSRDFAVEQDGIDFICWGSSFLNLIQNYISKPNKQRQINYCQRLNGNNESDFTSDFTNILSKMGGSQILYASGKIKSENDFHLCFHTTSQSGYGASATEIKDIVSIGANGIPKGMSWINPIQAEVVYENNTSTLVAPRSIITQDQFFLEHTVDCEANLDVINGVLFPKKQYGREYGCLEFALEYYDRKVRLPITNPTLQAKITKRLKKSTLATYLNSDMAKAYFDAKFPRFGCADWQESVVLKSGKCPIDPNFLGVNYQQIDFDIGLSI